MKQNLPILTGLRFFAAFYVFIFHVDIRYPLDFLGKTLSEFIAQGAVGVNVFFILSGFILYYNYHDRKISYIEFILKRLAKIYPVYLVGFILCFFVVKAMHIKIENFFEIMMMNLLLVQSYLPRFSMMWYGGGSWSISTEFFFYLTFPLILYFILQLGKRGLLIFGLFCYVLSFIPGILFNLDIIDSKLNYSFPLSRVWEFMAGMITAALVIKHKITINNFLLLATFLFSALFFHYVGKNLSGYVIQNIIVVPLMIVILISATKEKFKIFSFLGTRFFEYLGKISYSFYIVQLPLMIFLDNSDHFFIINIFTTIIVVFIINLLGAIIIYHIVELPLHQFLNKKIKKIFDKKQQFHYN